VRIEDKHTFTATLDRHVSTLFHITFLTLWSKICTHYFVSYDALDETRSVCYAKFKNWNC